LGANIRGNSLERHDSTGTCILGDLGLLNVNDIHDDATLKHFCHTALNASCSDCL
jgi:hypothetical protein